MSIGHIYKVTCKTTGKVYVGQTQEYKTKNNRPYHYGMAGRWSDHVSSSFKGLSPLHRAIQEYGSEDFTIEILETTTQDFLDEKEAEYIEKLNAKVPNGYNCNRHSRCKHREVSTLVNFYLTRTESIKVVPTKRLGKLKNIEIRLFLKNGERTELTFGQAKDAIFKETFEEVQKYLEEFRKNDVPIEIDERLKDIENVDLEASKEDPSEQKLKSYEGLEIKNITISIFNKSLVALYIKTEDKGNRICFGGKTIPIEEAYEKAKEFINKLPTKPLKINDKVVKVCNSQLPS